MSVAADLAEVLHLPAAFAKVYQAMKSGAPAVRCPCCRSRVEAELGEHEGAAAWLYRCRCGAIADAAPVLPT